MDNPVYPVPLAAPLADDHLARAVDRRLPQQVVNWLRERGHHRYDYDSRACQALIHALVHLMGRPITVNFDAHHCDAILFRPTPTGLEEATMVSDPDWRVAVCKTVIADLS